ncbi:LexA family transcriptional regulator [Gluconobacter frateurii]|uniref:Transcriptional regulator n=1 Tax=Gluconobacter frateurii NRIC 0228 TaxID=1307946 RepID=A0ABQ0Q8W5_9PROT|nr:LexA family transcriptional regulator [Gluconobacter frateurii]GBR09392.1 putative transcriptional regulator [Gluconobacter frateurii NRIC 0228]GLP91976.1 hypothetical protein GCM10007868_30510 [Gluconobacter frateurii]
MTSTNQKIGKEDFADSENNSEEVFRYRRLKSCVEAAGGNAHVAALSGIAASTLSAYMNGGEWKVGVARKIADACGTSLQWLLFGDEGKQGTSSDRTPPVLSEKTNDKTKIISGYDVELSAGFGFTPNTNIEVVSFSISADILPDELLQPYRKLIAVRARGDSMEPYICSGDIIVLDLNDRSIFTGGVYGLRVGDQLLVKRLSVRANGNLIVASDNARYPTDEISATEIRQMTEDGGSPMAIIGRVVWRMGMGLS